ncbi:MAG: HAD family hydrolase [Proteobacteria bacterium]|nr:HAD family hydrolase [Pseudomonadota bacterium]
MHWHAVLFDLDDTLYLERDFVLGGFRAVAAWLAGECGQDPEELNSLLAGWFEQGVRGNTFNMLLQRLSLRREGLLEQLVGLYREHEPRISPSPEVPVLLAGLEKKCALGLVSDGYSRTQRRKLKALGLADRFRAMVISDELPDKARKPSPRPFWAALEGLGVAPENAVYVADNPEKDFVGARRAGLASVRVRRPQGIYSHLEPVDRVHEPDLEVADLVELERVLAALAASRST